MVPKRLLSGLLVVLLLAGCANLPRIWLYGGYVEDAQTSAFRFSGANRDFRTSVIGNPFDEPKADTDRAVIAAMRGEDKGLDTKFTLTPRTNYKNYHIIMLFNPVRDAAGKDGCNAPRSGGKGGDGTPLILAALFCDGDKLLYGVAGSRTGITSAAHPGFRTLVKDVMLYFVPRHSMRDGPREENEDSN
jgi:hypothetical protein